MPKLVRWIWILLIVHLALGMVAYAHFLLTGEYVLLGWYFAVAGSLFFLVMTVAECCLAFICRSWFDRDEPMRLVWGMIACAALARLAGTLLREILNGSSPWGSWHWFNFHSTGFFADAGQLGLVLGGPVSMAFLAIGLGRVLRIKRRFHILASLTRGDRALLLLVLAFTIIQVVMIFPLLARHPSVGTKVLWLSDPLLALLLIEAILVRRSVIRMGLGLVAMCWGMFVLAIVTTSAGDAALWAANHNLLSERLLPLTWYIWFVAAAAFTSAPAYQLAAMSLTNGEVSQLVGELEPLPHKAQYSGHFQE